MYICTYLFWLLLLCEGEVIDDVLQLLLLFTLTEVDGVGHVDLFFWFLAVDVHGITGNWYLVVSQGFSNNPKSFPFLPTCLFQIHSRIVLLLLDLQSLLLP